MFLLFFNIPQQGHAAGAQLAYFEHTRAMPVFQCFHLHWLVCVCVCVCALSCFSRVWLFASQTVAHQAPLTVGLPGKNTWVFAMLFSRGSSWPRDQACVSCSSCTAGGFFTAEPLGSPYWPVIGLKPIWPLNMYHHILLRNFSHGYIMYSHVHLGFFVLRMGLHFFSGTLLEIHSAFKYLLNEWMTYQEAFRCVSPVHPEHSVVVKWH